MSGGLSRHTTLLNDNRTKESSVLFLDNGGLLPEPVRADQDLVADIGFGIMSFNNLDGMNLSQSEFCFGIDYLVSRAKKNSFPFISTNITFSIKTPWLKKYIIKEVDGLRIGVLGVLPEDAFSDKSKASLGSTLLVSSPREAIEKTVAEIHENTDAIILLSRFNVAETVKLIKGIPEIKLAIALGEVLEGTVVHENDQLVVPSGKLGKSFLSAVLSVDSSGAVHVKQNKPLALDNLVAHSDLIDTMIVVPFTERRKTERQVQLAIAEQLQKDNVVTPMALNEEEFMAEVKKRQAELKALREKAAQPGQTVGTMVVEGTGERISIVRTTSAPTDKATQEVDQTPTKGASSE